MRESQTEKPKAQSTPNGTTLATPYLDSLRLSGFTVIRSLLPPHLLLALRGAAAYITSRARTGKWAHIRTVPKQFPPWPPTPDAEGGIWGVQHLLHPEMPVRDLFAELYFGDAVLDVVKELLGGVGDEELVMELFNLLVSPSGGVGFALGWHRDDVKMDLGREEERAELERKSPPGTGQAHAQYNIALTEDRSLIVVPGSHARVMTDEERAVAPLAEMPGQVVVQLEPGDAVFYDSNILHRGVYFGIKAGNELGRLTLHGSVGLAGRGDERARQVLQHGVGEWIERAKFGPEGSNLERAEAMRKRLVEMGKGRDWGIR